MRLSSCDGTHDGQPQLCIQFQSADAVIHEKNADAQGFQFSCVADGIQDVSGEPADFLGDDQAELTHFGVADHTVELDSLFCAGSGDTFIGVDPIQFPVRLPVDVLLEIPLLGFKGVCLIVLVRGHPAVACNINHACHLLPVLSRKGVTLTNVRAGTVT